MAEIDGFHENQFVFWMEQELMIKQMKGEESGHQLDLHV